MNLFLSIILHQEPMFGNHSRLVVHDPSRGLFCCCLLSLECGAGGCGGTRSLGFSGYVCAFEERSSKYDERSTIYDQPRPEPLLNYQYPAVPSRSPSMSTNGMVPEGQYTSMVYSAIKDARFPEAVHLLTSELGVRECPKILLGRFCCFSSINKCDTSFAQLSAVSPCVILAVARRRKTSKVPRLRS